MSHDPLLLDTCAAIWISDDQPIAQEALEALQRRPFDG